MDLDRIVVGVSFLLCFASRTFGGFSSRYTEEGTRQIVNTIFHKYTPEVPPRRNYPDPVMLSVNLETWKDSRLAWYHNVVEEITVEREKIWTPVLSIDNALEAPTDIHSPKVVIKSNGEIYLYRRVHLKTFCETNLNSTVEDCEIVLGSNLLNERIIDFDMNSSSCNVTSSTHALHVPPGYEQKRSEERPMLKENAAFPEFVCILHIEQSVDAVPEVVSEVPNRI